MSGQSFQGSGKSLEQEGNPGSGTHPGLPTDDDGHTQQVDAGAILDLQKEKEEGKTAIVEMPKAPDEEPAPDAENTPT